MIANGMEETCSCRLPSLIPMQSFYFAHMSADDMARIGTHPFLLTCLNAFTAPSCGRYWPSATPGVAAQHVRDYK